MRLPHFSLPWIGWRWFITCIMVVALVGVQGYWWWMQRPSWIQFGSVGARSFSVAWISRKPSTGCVKTIGLVFPIYQKQICFTDTPQTARLMRLTTLQPNTWYVSYWTTNGWLDPTSFRLTRTRSDIEKPRLPSALYGSVITAENVVAPGVLVMVWPVAISSEYPELAITNASGNWVVDVGVFGGRITDWMIESGSTLWNWNWRQATSSGGLVPMLEVQP